MACLGLTHTESASLISRRSPQVFQLLGYHLDLTPRFLNSLEQMLSTGVLVERCKRAALSDSQEAYNDRRAFTELYNY